MGKMGRLMFRGGRYSDADTDTDADADTGHILMLVTNWCWCWYCTDADNLANSDAGADVGHMDGFYSADGDVDPE